MCRHSAIPLIFVIAGAVYALDRGVYLGSEFYTVGAPCCPELDKIQKRCKYLFITGISEVPASDGERSAPGTLMRDGIEPPPGWHEPPRDYVKKPLARDNGYCRIFGS